MTDQTDLPGGKPVPLQEMGLAESAAYLIPSWKSPPHTPSMSRTQTGPSWPGMKAAGG